MAATKPVRMEVPAETGLPKPQDAPAAPAAQREPEHHEIAARAYENWERRGCPHGSSEEDWLLAEQELKSQSHA